MFLSAPSHSGFLRRLSSAASLAAGVFVAGVFTAGGAEARRLALVVGNGAYDSAPRLKNAVNDATDIADALKALGFEVTLLTDIGSQDFWTRLDSFAAGAGDAESTVFYYSGHAFQMNGVNFLVPVGADLGSRDRIRDEMWSLDGIIARLQDSRRQTLVFLDACRDDPLPASVRGSGSANGLARLQTGTGTFVAFATAPGAVAYDGAPDATNSPFTQALLDNISSPGLSVSDMMIEVRNEVVETTMRRQTPWDQSSLREQFYFVPAEEQKQELSEADFELLAQLPPEDRAKFIELLRGAGFSESSLAEAEAQIEVASLNLEMAKDGGLTVGAPAPQIAAAEPAPAPAPAPDPVVVAAAGPAAPAEEEFSFDVVDGGTTLSAPGAVPPAFVPPASADPVGEGIALAAAEPAQLPPTDSPAIIASRIEPLASPALASAALRASEAPPVRLAALSWDTRSLIAINALTVDRLRVEGNEVTPETEEGRALLAAISPRTAEGGAPAIDPVELARAAQAELKRLGCYQMRVDGQWGRGSQTALTSYYLAKKVVPDSLEPTPALLSQLRGEGKVVCTVRVATVKPAKPRAALAAAPAAAKGGKLRKAAAPAAVAKRVETSLKTTIGGF